MKPSALYNYVKIHKYRCVVYMSICVMYLMDVIVASICTLIDLYIVLHAQDTSSSSPWGESPVCDSSVSLTSLC